LDKLIWRVHTEVLGEIDIEKKEREEEKNNEGDQRKTKKHFKDMRK